MGYTLVSIDDIREAAQRIAGIAVKTPLVRAAFDGVAGEIWLKAESLQPIGAFKIRGAANKILQLTPEEIARGVITYSSGNHAQGVAYAAREVGAKAVIVMPSNAPAIKRAATLALGAEIVDVGVASSERLAMAEKLVREHGYVVIPPYDDEQIIAGQATCGLEIVEDAAGCGPGAVAGIGRRAAERRSRGGQAAAAAGKGLRRRAGTGRRYGGELSHRKDRDLAGGIDQPDHCRRPAHAERGRAEFRAYSGLCGRNRDRDGGGDSRRHAGHCGRNAPGSRAQRRGRNGGAAVSCRANCRSTARRWPW